MTAPRSGVRRARPNPVRPPRHRVGTRSGWLRREGAVIRGWGPGSGVVRLLLWDGGGPELAMGKREKRERRGGKRAGGGYYGMARALCAGRVVRRGGGWGGKGRARDYYGMARPSATGGGQVGGKGVLWDGQPFCGWVGGLGSIMGWGCPMRRRRGGRGKQEAYYGMAGPSAARASGVLWDGTIPSACDRAAIMGCRRTYCLPGKYYGMEGEREGGGGGDAIMGCRCSPGRGGCSQSCGSWGAHQDPPPPLYPGSLPMSSSLSRPAQGPSPRLPLPSLPPSRSQ